MREAKSLVQLISSSNNNYIKHLVKLRESKHYRDSKGKCLLHADYRLLKEALVWNPSANTQKVIPESIVFYSKDSSQNTDIFPKAHQLVCLTNESLLRKSTGLSDIEPSNCFLLELKKPSESPLSLNQSESPASFVVANQIQDPGNMGNILRCCVAFGFNHLYILPGTVDCFNEKVIRASRGAMFLQKENGDQVLSYERGSVERLLEITQHHRMQILVSDVMGESISDASRTDNHSSALILNNESAGVGDILRQTLKTAGAKFVTIPTSAYCESLNVASAAAIFLYSFGKIKNL
jgi:RNA methyltransferase, TrmH family